MNGIYGYKDLETGYVVYIGRDSYIDKNNRKSDHMSTKGQKRQQIDKALQKNPDRYEYFVIKKGEYTNEELNILESHYIDFYGTYTNRKRHGEGYGFNFNKGGEGNTGYQISEETRKKLSKAFSGKNNPQYNKKGENHPAYGYRHTKEAKRKISEANKGKELSDETKEKISRAHTGKELSVEHKKILAKDTTTGFFRLSKEYRKKYKQGYIWRYSYGEGKSKKG